MTGPRAMAAFLVVCLLSAVLFAQRTTSESVNDPPIGPMAITGSPSSGRHCVSGQAANVHPLGWVQSGTSYTITFESDITLVTAVSRLDFDGNESRSGYGTPDIALNASTSGTMALLVTGNGRAGCYRYKAQIQPAGSSISGAAASANALFSHALIKPAKSPIQMMAISGMASSAKVCVGGNGVAKVHALGRVETGARVSVTFDSDFDAKAGITNTDLVGQRGTFSIDDDSGGNLDPQMNFTASHPGTLVLYVTGTNGAKGCYHYRVDATSLPAPSPTPTPTPAPAPTPAPSPAPAPPPTPSPAPTPAPAPPARIESVIDGTFEGWTGETVFALANGQYWQQTSYSYVYHYAYRPKVVITRSGSVYVLSVEGVQQTINVQPLQSVIKSNIEGTFEGWTGATVFPLTNGQVWQQSSYAYTYHYAYRPEVLIFSATGLSSSYKMRVDGVSSVIAVRRIR